MCQNVRSYTELPTFWHKLSLIYRSLIVKLIGTTCLLLGGLVLLLANGLNKDKLADKVGKTELCSLPQNEEVKVEGEVRGSTSGTIPNTMSLTLASPSSQCTVTLNGSMRTLSNIGIGTIVSAKGMNLGGQIAVKSRDDVSFSPTSGFNSAGEAGGYTDIYSIHSAEVQDYNPQYKSVKVVHESAQARSDANSVVELLIPKGMLSELYHGTHRYSILYSGDGIVSSFRRVD